MTHNLDTSVLPEFSQAHAIVFGDVMLDRYWYGDTSRISPEAPVPVVKVDGNELRPGGAANVALNLRALGASVSLYGCVGCDVEAQQLRELLEAAGVVCHFKAVPDYPTVTKLRVIGRNQQLIRMDFEKGFHDVSMDSLVDQFRDEVQHADVVLLSDYAKGCLNQSNELINIASTYHKPVMIDPKGTDLKRYQGATLITPNRKEFEEIVGACKDQAEMVARAKGLISEYDITAILVTLGKEGMLLVQRDCEPFTLPTRARQVFDVTGAGDTVHAAFAATLAIEKDMQRAAYIANTAAGIVVGKLGAGTVTPMELRRALKKQNASQLGVVSEAELLAMLEDNRMNGERIVMTNGCFDILHSGHIHYLEQAKALGDRLIVAVNSDESVRGLKGDARPFNDLQERMDILAGLGSVDWVVAFSEDTPARLISKLLPDVLVKGGDYQVKEIAGHEAVLANGGDVKILDFIKGRSTTNLVNKIRESEVVL